MQSHGLDRLERGRVWPPRDTVKKVLTERGLKFLPLQEGIDFFMDEMTDTVTTEVVITGLDEAFDRDSLLCAAPFLDRQTKKDG